MYLYYWNVQSLKNNKLVYLPLILGPRSNLVCQGDQEIYIFKINNSKIDFFFFIFRVM